MNKIGFNYEYKSMDEVLNIIFNSSSNSSIFNLNILDFLVYLFLFVILIFIIFFVYPNLILYKKLYDKKKQVLLKKKFLNRIKIQKDIEDEIERELNI